MSIGERLKLLRNNADMTQQEFSNHLGVKRAIYTHYENDRRDMSQKVILSVAKSTKCNLNWLLTGEGEMFSNITHSACEENCQILTVDSEIAAGEPVIANSKPLESLTIGHSLIKDTSKVFCFRVNGKSMEPEIKNGDLVITNKRQDWLKCEKRICAVNIDGEITLKVVVFDHYNERIVLLSKNEDYDPIIINPKKQHIKLIGCLIAVIRQF